MLTCKGFIYRLQHNMKVLLHSLHLTRKGFIHRLNDLTRTLGTRGFLARFPVSVKSLASADLEAFHRAREIKNLWYPGIPLVAPNLNLGVIMKRLILFTFNPQPPMYAAFLYDAVYQYAIALNNTLTNNEEPNGRNIISKLLNKEYNSK